MIKRQYQGYVMLKKKIIFLLAIFTFGFTTEFNFVIIEPLADEVLDIKCSNTWNLSPFIIDDKGLGNFTWEQVAMQPWCSGLGTENSPYLIENITIDAGGVGSCIKINNSNVHFIIRKCSFTNSGHYMSGIIKDSGINIANSKNGLILNNHIFENYFAIAITNSSFLTIYSNNISNNHDFYGGISGYQGISNTYIENNSFKGSVLAIELAYQIFNNSIVNNFLEDAQIIIRDHGYEVTNGIAKYNNIVNNTIIGNDAVRNYGIYLENADYNTISNNTFIGNYNEFFGEYQGIGIRIQEKFRNNKINNNKISGEMGIKIMASSLNDNILSENLILSCSEYGIYIDNDLLKGENNFFVENVVEGCKIGIGISDQTFKDNYFYQNYFINNEKHLFTGIPYYSNNFWNNSEIGNYWDNYSGSDLNDDGIGDFPHNISSSPLIQDMLPIWDDGDDKGPEIIIHSPITNDVFGKSSPEFSISINDDSSITSRWYTLDGGINNYTFSGLSGTINHTAWEVKGTELVNIIFYARDSLGHSGFSGVLVWKDILPPKIVISSPMNYQLCGIAAPSFSLVIDKPNIYLKQYSINGRPNITFSTETYFDQLEWNEIGNGSVSITFFITDSVGNKNSSTVVVNKDIYPPVISVYEPILNEVYGHLTPSFNLSITGNDVVSIWYTIEGDLTNYSILEHSGTINQEVWDDLDEGEITITFYAQDEAGNIGEVQVIIEKEIPDSDITIVGYGIFLIITLLGLSILLLKKKIKKLLI